jgi:hypothetical protein
MDNCVVIPLPYALTFVRAAGALLNLNKNTLVHFNGSFLAVSQANVSTIRDMRSSHNLPGWIRWPELVSPKFTAVQLTAPDLP